MAESERKAKLLYLIDIMKSETDEQHPLSAEEICKLLAEKGISAERKAIYGDIDTLVSCGYNIIKTGVPKRGFFLGSRDFELAEICLLVDAVQAAGFITRNKTDELIGKLENLISSSQAAEIKKRVHIENRSKSGNEAIYYIIDEVNNAIISRKKIEFDYGKYELENGKSVMKYKHHKVSPYALIWDNDHYYLVSNNEKYENLMHLRIDRMKDVKITKEIIRHFSEVSEYKYQFDTADYARKTFNMFGGEPKRIDIECDVRLLDQIQDKFGSGLWLRGDESGGKFRFSTTACVSDGLVGWLMQFGSQIKVLFPRELKEQMKQRVAGMGELYND